VEVLKKFRDQEKAAEKKAPLFVYFMKEPPHSGNRLNESVINQKVATHESFF